MPFTESQRRLFRADLGRLRRGEKAVTGMSRERLVKMLGEGVREKGSGNKSRG